MAAPPSRLSANHAKSGLALACFIGPAKTFNDKDLTGLIFVEDSASPRTIPLDIDFAIVNPSPSVEANVQVPHEEVMAKFDCKVIVKDIFEENPNQQSLQALLRRVMLKLRNIRKGEHNRKKRWKIKNANKSFFQNPYQAGKNILDPKCNIKLTVDKGTLDKHKASSVADPLHNIPLPPLKDLPEQPTILKGFNTSKFNFSVFMRILNSRRNSSSPGINMIPYRVYKKCPQICSFLFKIFGLCLKHCFVPVQCRVATEVYIPKAKPPNPINIKDFRPISLLNVEGKLFFSLVSNRLENHIISNNKLINSSIQKGCMEKISGCWEHMSMVWNELKSSKAEHGNLAAVWLDIANAYGSVPHQLIFFALQRYGVPEHWIKLIGNYYKGLWSISQSASAPSINQSINDIFSLLIIYMFYL